MDTYIPIALHCTASGAAEPARSRDHHTSPGNGFRLSNAERLPRVLVIKM